MIIRFIVQPCSISSNTERAVVWDADDGDSRIVTVVSYGEHDELVLLVGLDEVVHEVGIEERLYDACDEGGPDHVFPPEYPASVHAYQWRM